MMDYSGLKAEIVKPAYNGMTDAQIVAALNAATTAGGVLAKVSDILAYLRLNNLWLPIKVAATATPPNMGAVAAVDIFQDVHTPAIDMSSSAAQTLMTDLVSSTPPLLTSAQMQALTSYSQATTSIAAKYGFTDGVNVHELAAARVWPGVSA